MDLCGFTQSQGHGFQFENIIKCQVFGLSPEKNNTCKYDISCTDNIWNNNECISIKSTKYTKSSAICCGDILRFYEYDLTKQNTIIVVCYKQDNYQNKSIKEIYEINYNKEFHKLLFGNITKPELIKYVEFIKNIPKGRVPVRIKNDYKNIKKHLQTSYNMKITINPKVDSKNQRRVQCSIPNFTNLLEHNPCFIKSYSKSPILRGITITSLIYSGIRKRVTRSDTKYSYGD